MIRSHLLNYFTSQPWLLHRPVYESMSELLEAHALGRKDEWRAQAAEMPMAFLFDGEDAEPIDERDFDDLVDGVAVIRVRGVLARHADEVNGSCQPQGRSYATIIEQLAAANASDQVQAIALQLETPGGAAAGAQECYEAISASAKPVHAFIDGYAFSAGYYLAAACESITASSRACGVGSIGCIMATWDTSALYEKRQLRRVVVRSGPEKALGQEGEPLDERAVADMQRTVSAYGAAFADAVAAGRGLDEAQCAGVCTGRTWMADEALGLGLVDALASFSDFLAAIAGGPTKKESPMAFGKKKPAGDENPGGTMSVEDFAALARRFPQQVAQIGDLASEGTSPEAIATMLLEEELTASEQQIASLGEQLTAAQAAHEAALSERDEKIAALEEKIASFKDWDQATDGEDPGSDAAADAALGAPDSEARLKATWDRMSQEDQAHYMNRFGAFAHAIRAGYHNPEIEE